MVQYEDFTYGSLTSSFHVRRLQVHHQKHMNIEADNRAGSASFKASMLLKDDSALAGVPSPPVALRRSGIVSPK